jgi:hypothetical protein
MDKQEGNVKYWYSVMDWPIVRGWKCETCQHEHPYKRPLLILGAALVWGLAHGVCRCEICHTNYTMKKDGERITTPDCLLKEEYKKPARQGWLKFGKPISTFTDAMWEEAFALAGKEGEA